MTLRDLFAITGENPSLVLFYFTLLPTVALLANFMGKGEGNLAPWKHLYSLVAYLVCVPGILAAGLSVYFFLFERRSILDTDVYVQILPIVSMIFTLYTIRQNADFQQIPGFDKLSAMVTVIACTLGIMLFVHKMHFVIFTNMPFQYVIGIFVVLFVLIKMSVSKIFS